MGSAIRTIRGCASWLTSISSTTCFGQFWCASPASAARCARSSPKPWCLVGWSATLEELRAADALLAVRQKGGGRRRGGKAETARRAEESTLNRCAVLLDPQESSIRWRYKPLIFSSVRRPPRLQP